MSVQAPACVINIVNNMLPNHAANIVWRLSALFPELQVVCGDKDDSSADLDPMTRFNSMFPNGVPTINGKLPTVGQMLSYNLAMFDRRLKSSDRKTILRVHESSGKFPAIRTNV